MPNLTVTVDKLGNIHTERVGRIFFLTGNIHAYHHLSKATVLDCVKKGGFMKHGAAATQLGFG